MVPSLSQSCLFSMLFYSNFSGLSSFLSLIKRIPVVWCFCNWLFIVLFLIPSLSLLISPVSFSCQYHFMFLHFGFPFETDVHFLYPYTNSTVHCFFCVMNLHLSPFFCPPVSQAMFIPISISLLGTGFSIYCLHLSSKLLSSFCVSSYCILYFHCCQLWFLYFPRTPLLIMFDSYIFHFSYTLGNSYKRNMSF